MQIPSRIITTLLACCFSATVLAEIKIEHSVEVESVTKDKNGKELVQFAPAGKVIPGDIVVYSITATNTGKEAADKIGITDAISEHNTYIAGSAQSSAMGKNTVITFSVDGGKTFDSADKLSVTENGITRPAQPEDYTHIHWQLDFALAPGKSTKVMFKARLK